MALLAWPIARRLRDTEATVRRQQVDLANLAQLSQYIVQNLRESIVVVDHENRIRLINESAAALLGDRSAYPGALLGEASPQLLYLLETWRRAHRAGDTLPSQTFVAADGGHVVQPHFAPLGGSRADAGHRVPRRHGVARGEDPAIQARGARPTFRQHRARDPQSGRRHEPCRAIAR